jgi:rRNA maturation endonuclease Nob1
MRLARPLQIATMREQAMRKHWWCANCLIQIELDVHGRCKICGSNAVDRMQPSPEQVKVEPPQDARSSQ